MREEGAAYATTSLTWQLRTTYKRALHSTCSKCSFLGSSQSNLEPPEIRSDRPSGNSFIHQNSEAITQGMLHMSKVLEWNRGRGLRILEKRITSLSGILTSPVSPHTEAKPIVLMLSRQGGISRPSWGLGRLLPSGGFRGLVRVHPDVRRVWALPDVSFPQPHSPRSPWEPLCSQIVNKMGNPLGFLRKLRGEPPDTPSIWAPCLSPELSVPSWAESAPPRGLAQGLAWGVVAAAGSFSGSCLEKWGMSLPNVHAVENSISACWLLQFSTGRLLG